MRSITKSVAKVLTGLTASAFATISWSATLTVATESQKVQTPATAGQSGISYVQTGASTSTLQVYTEGFLFCGNPADVVASPATLSIAHEDQSFSPAHPWTFATSTDAQQAVYTGGTLSLNPAAPTTLICLGTSAEGAVASATTEGIFDDGYESATDRNYAHLINWVVPQGFDWSDPDWSQVPTDPCNPDGTHPALVVEDQACAAATGVRGSLTAGPTRAASIWTATDGTTFTYLFRVDARLGPQAPGAAAEMRIPDERSPNDVTAPLQVLIRDAFDGAFLGTQNGDGRYCLLTTLPASLDTTVCSGVSTVELNGAPLSRTVTLDVPPLGVESASFYVAVMRPVVGGHQTMTTPVVGASVLVERAAIDEGGDKFRGDDIAFGFMPSSSGFSWMTGQ